MGQKWSKSQRAKFTTTMRNKKLAYKSIRRFPRTGHPVPSETLKFRPDLQAALDEEWNHLSVSQKCFALAGILKAMNL